ncbi:MAG: Stp1/IreP family PP2C-type Ser/Thr phosphatase [Nitrosospira multiformis]|nr:Stp1/IreP family PP2C-type Ser/Thr phosphatase [Nitrosospira multiformis]
MISLHSAGATDVGLWRDNNEDSYLIIPQARVLALADGMGGAAAGEAASQYFVDRVRSTFSELTFPPEDAVADRIQHVFELAKGRMLEHIIQHPEDVGMGCTADILVFDGGRYVIGHVGDSRVYLLRDGRLQQLTKDHSLVQSQVDRGMLTPEEAKHHPRKNILLRVVGTDSSMACDIVQGGVLGNDIFLLCSDGLTDMVENADIEIVLASAESLEQKLERLISAALEAGGKDNVTVVLCEIEDV